MFSILSVSLISLAVCSVHAGSTPQGDPCSAANNHLDPASHRLLTECNDQSFCLNNICTPKLCVRDEYPFGYDETETIPPVCPHGTFCPDEGSGCRPLLALGQPCQLNRDDQCAPPPDVVDLASDMNFNGSLCLLGKCTYANISLHHTCQIENTTYLETTAAGDPYTTIVIRDNCRTPGLYCNAANTKCEPTKPLQSKCQTDRECETYNCDSTGFCAKALNSYVRVAPWQYGVSVVCFVAYIAIACLFLMLIRRRQRMRHYLEIQEYATEQISLRKSIILLHTAATERFQRDSDKTKNVEFR